MATTRNIARAATALLLALAALAVLVAGGRLVCPEAGCRVLPMDEIAFALVSHSAALTLPFFAALTWLGSLWVLLPAALIVAVMQWQRTPSRQALFVPIALAGGSLLAWSVKWWVDRARPDAFSFAAATDIPHDPSFPSGHTLQAVAFALALALSPGSGLPRWIGLLVIGVALGVGISRIVLQVHFASDVLFAVLAAVLWVGALRLLPCWRLRS